MLVCPKCGSTYTRTLEFCGLDGDRLIESMDDPLIGRTIDRYEIVEPIGTGGMARVYRARHLFLEQDFAIKVLHGQIAADKSFAARFHREATTLGKIKHRNVVQVVDFGATKEGLLFLVMEYLDGPSLTEAIKRSGPFSPQRSAALARQLALGLGAAHSRGFVHRDLKPGNVILMEEDGLEVPKILDFGLVRLLEDEGRIKTQLTHHGQMFGTPAYMSPEQISGEDVDSRSDLYSLGVILYQMIVGYAPFSGDVADLVRHHVSSRPPRPPLEYGGLTPLAMKLLAKHAADRVQSAAEVVDAIDQLGLIDNVSQVPARRVSEPRAYNTLEFETRNERTPQVDSEISLEIRRSARAALGFRAHWRLVLALGLLGLVAFIVWVADQAGLLRRFTVTAEPIANIEPAAGNPPVEQPPVKKKKKKKKKKKVASDTGGMKPGVDSPASGQSPRTPADTPTRVDDPPTMVEGAPRIDQPTVVEEPPAGIEPPVEPRASAKSFQDLDSSLGWTLSSRGLAWEDIAEVETEAAWKWARWFKVKEPPTPAELAETYEKLLAVARGMVIDRELLKSKLARARIALARVPESARDERYHVLLQRADQLDATVRADPFRDPAERIAAEITLLESDASSALREAGTSTGT